MTDAQPPKRYKRPHYFQRPMTTGDIAILWIVSAVVVAAAVIGLIVIVVNLDMTESTVARWTMAGALIAPFPTAIAVWAGMRSSRMEREASDVQHRRVLIQEAWRSDIGVTLDLLGPLEAFHAAMRKADSDVRRYREDLEHPEAQTSFEDQDYLDMRSRTIHLHQRSVVDEYRRVRIAAIRVTSRDLRPPLDEACQIISLLGKQIDEWSLAASKGKDLDTIVSEIDVLGLDMGSDTGVFGVASWHVLKLVRDAAASSKGIDPRANLDFDDEVLRP
ncbi:hypothetical protein [Prescottella equi]